MQQTGVRLDGMVRFRQTLGRIKRFSTGRALDRAVLAGADVFRREAKGPPPRRASP